MIISPKHKFVFIANPKTGSATIQHTLIKCIEDKEKIVGLKFPPNDNDLLHSKHLPCFKLQDHHPEFNDYYKFAFVRNPWARVLSWYFFCKMAKYPLRNTSNISFDEFLIDKEYRHRVWRNQNQTQCIFTQGCDFIGRTEHLQSDFNIICDKIGIPHQEFIVRENKTEHKHYTEYYNDETIKIIADCFAEDIDHFNFEYGK